MQVLAALAGLVATSASAQENCGSKWRTVTDPVAGATYEMAAEPRRSYFVSYGDNFPSATYEQGWLTNDDCATFTVTVWDLGANRVADPKGLFDTHQANSTKGGSNAQIHWSRSLQVDGFPAREFLLSRNIDLFGHLVYYRTLIVARNNKILLFNSHWRGGKTSANADRSYKSIRLIPQAPNEHLRTYAFLSEAITKYWMFPSKSYDYGVYFTPTLLTRLEARRAADKASIEAFGYPRDFTFVRATTAGKVVRVRHDDATVDWTVQDDGKAITAISWRKFDPNAPATPAPATASSSAPAPNHAAIAAAQQRFRTAIITAPALGTRFAVGSQTDPCTTSYALLGSGQTPEQALANGFRIDWRSAKAVNFVPGKPDADAWWKDYIQVDSASGGYWPLHPSKEQVGPMLAAGNELMRLCKGVPK